MTLLTERVKMLLHRWNLDDDALKDHACHRLYKSLQWLPSLEVMICGLGYTSQQLHDEQELCLIGDYLFGGFSPCCKSFPTTAS